MAINMIKWVVTTAAAYEKLGSKENNALYFLSDTGEIYKGSKSFTEAVVLVSEFPAKGALGKIYVHNTTLEGKIWAGSEWKTIIEPVVKTLTDETTVNGPVSGEAVKAYVTKKFTTEVQGQFVEGITYDKVKKQLKYTKNKQEQTVAIDGFVTGASYAGETGILTFTVQGGEAISINLPKEDFVSGGSYDNRTHEIVLTLTQGGEVRIPATDLVDVYTASSTETVEMTVHDNNITANVKVSSEGGNQIVKKSDGLYVAVPNVDGKMNKVAGERADEILTATVDGQAQLSGLKAGGETLSEAPNGTTLATEAAVSAIKTALENQLGNKFDKSKVKTAPAASASVASDEHVLSEKAVLTKMEALDNKKIDKTNIATTINAEGASNEKVVSEAAIVAAMSWSVLN